MRRTLATLWVLTLLGAACSGGAGSGAEQGGAPESSEGVAAATDGASDTTGDGAQTAGNCADLSSAALVHFQGPYTQVLIDGARAAAEDCGAQFQDGGPAAFDAQASVGLFQDVMSTGVDAVVTVAYPAELWVRPIDEAVNSGVLVSTYDVASPASLQHLHTAPKAKDLGYAMADVLSEELGDGASGEVVAGLCIPGLDILEARVDGFVERMAELQPDVTVEGPIDVSFDQTENFARWTDVRDTHPDALAYLGFCENDLPSLVRLKEQEPDAEYLIASIGINPDGLAGIKDGLALAAIDQKPFMQGYVAMAAMLDSLMSGAEPPRGWIDVGPEVVTADNVDEVAEREASLSQGADQTQEYYQDQIDEIMSNLDSRIQSFGDLIS
jgi:ABC-type sugar transport system substrate-binding protein